MNQEIRFTNEEFQRLRAHQIDILREFDKVCQKNGIRYSIAYGTLLGAVRHKGFIPWDDDADIFMLREDYEAFKKIAGQMDPHICYFQDHDTDPEYRWGYGKLRKTGTTYVRVGQEHLKCKTGVFVDVFPLDDMPKTLLGRACKVGYCTILRKIAYSEVGKYSEQKPWFLRQVYGLLSKIPIDFVFRCLKKAEKQNDHAVGVLCLSFPNSPSRVRSQYSRRWRLEMSRSWFLELSKYQFESLELYGISAYDDFLKFVYNEYMTLPPMEKRRGNSGVCKFEF